MYYVINLWPAAFDLRNLKEIEKLIAENVRIREKSERIFTYLGLRNYLVQIYKEGRWSGSFRNNFKGIDKKLIPCYREHGKTYLFVVEADSLETIVKMKEKIRVFCQREKHSIHASDTKQEADFMLQIWNNEASCEMMNCFDMKVQKKFVKNFHRLLKIMKRYQVDPDDFVVVSEAVLALYNKIESSKMSWVSKKELPEGFEKYNGREADGIEEGLRAEVLQKENQFTYFGIHFALPELVQKGLGV